MVESPHPSDWCNITSWPWVTVFFTSVSHLSVPHTWMIWWELGVGSSGCPVGVRNEDQRWTHSGMEHFCSLSGRQTGLSQRPMSLLPWPFLREAVKAVILHSGLGFFWKGFSLLLLLPGKHWSQVTCFSSPDHSKQRGPNHVEERGGHPHSFFSTFPGSSLTH